MTQETFKTDYYLRFKCSDRKRIRNGLCQLLGIADTDLYRRMRLFCFSKSEWHHVINYVNEHPIPPKGDSGSKSNQYDIS